MTMNPNRPVWNRFRRINPFGKEFRETFYDIAESVYRWTQLEPDLERVLKREWSLSGGDTDGDGGGQPSSPPVFPAVVFVGVPMDATESTPTRWIYPWRRVRPVLVENGLKWKIVLGDENESGDDPCRYAINLYEELHPDNMENVGSGPTLTRLIYPDAEQGQDDLYDRESVVMMTREIYAPFDDAESGTEPHEPEHPCVNPPEGENPASLSQAFQFYFYATNPVGCDE